MNTNFIAVKRLGVCLLLLLVFLPCVYGQANKDYPLAGNWHYITPSYDLVFNFELKINKPFAPITYGAATQTRVDIDIVPNVTLKAKQVRHKKSITFWGRYPYSGAKGKSRVTLIHPDTLFWETLWLPESAATWIPERQKLVRVKD